MYHVKLPTHSITILGSLVLLYSLDVCATDYVWTGASDSAFASSLNWSPTGVPGVNDKGIFMGAGNGNTTIDINGANIIGLIVSNATAAAYTFGAGGVGAQTFKIQNNFAVYSTATRAQLVNANLNIYGDLTLTSHLTDGLTVAAGVSVVGATARTLQINGNGSGTISGVISNGAAMLSLTKANVGTWTLSGENTYTGTTIIGNGVLNVSSVVVTNGASGLGSAASSLVLGTAAAGGSTTGVLNYTGETATMTRGLVLAVPGTGALGGRLNVLTAGKTLTLTGSVDNTAGGKSTMFTVGGAGNTILAGVVGGGIGGITKTDSGTLTLKGSNTYTGVTMVSTNGGALMVNGNQTMATNTVTICPGSTLGGNGIIGGDTALSGTLAPGSGAGTLTFRRNLTVNNGSTCVFEAGDLVAVQGELDLNSNWTLELKSGFLNGGSVTLFTYGTLAAAPALAPAFTITNLDFTPSGPLTLTDTGTSIVLFGVRLPGPAATAIIIK